MFRHYMSDSFPPYKGLEYQQHDNFIVWLGFLRVSSWNSVILWRKVILNENTSSHVIHQIWSLGLEKYPSVSSTTGNRYQSCRCALSVHNFKQNKALAPLSVLFQPVTCSPKGSHKGTGAELSTKAKEIALSIFLKSFQV